MEKADIRNRKAAAFLKKKEEKGRFEVCEDDRYIRVSGKSFIYTYSKLTGTFQDMNFENQSILERPMEINIWRAPTDNDSDIKGKWKEAHYHRASSRGYETRWEEKDGSLVISTEMSMVAAPIQRILMIDAVWTIGADGVLNGRLDVKRDVEFPELPRFGVRLFLPKQMGQITYFGLGPVENYIDKNNASYHGLFSSSVKEMHEDYLRPQENGSRSDCDFVTIEGGDLSLSVAADKTFSFHASEYTQEELTEKAHNYELIPSGYTEFCVDYKQNGIGSESCGPELRKEYMFVEEEFTFEFTLIPGIK